MKDSNGRLKHLLILLGMYFLWCGWIDVEVQDQTVDRWSGIADSGRSAVHNRGSDLKFNNGYLIQCLLLYTSEDAMYRAIILFSCFFLLLLMQEPGQGPYLPPTPDTSFHYAEKQKNASQSIIRISKCFFASDLQAPCQFTVWWRPIQMTGGGQHHSSYHEYTWSRN